MLDAAIFIFALIGCWSFGAMTGILFGHYYFTQDHECRTHTFPGDADASRRDPAHIGRQVGRLLSRDSKTSGRMAHSRRRPRGLSALQLPSHREHTPS